MESLEQQPTGPIATHSPANDSAGVHSVASLHERQSLVIRVLFALLLELPLRLFARATSRLTTKR